MSRDVLCLDITNFANPGDRDRFLSWACRKLHGQHSDEGSESVASAMQSARGGIELIGVWAEDPGDRAFTVYACHGGWDGGWRQMLQLYVGVPESLFLSAIDDVRYSATTLALLGVPGNPSLTDLASGAVSGAHAVLEIIPVAAGSEPARARAIQLDQAPTAGYRLAGAFELGYQDLAVCALWITDAPIDLEEWRRRTEDDREVIGLRAYPGPPMSAGADVRLPGSGPGN